SIDDSIGVRRRAGVASFLLAGAALGEGNPMRHRLVPVLIVAAAVGLAACDSHQDVYPPGPPTAEVYIADRAPPPISGGTLLIMKDGHTGIAAASDRDRVSIVDLASQALTTEIKLNRDDEPGRVVEDADGHVHVVLRRGGSIATIDPAAGKLLARRPVCASPR